MEPAFVPPQICSSADSGLSLRCYETIRGLVYRHSRIALGAGKQALITGRLGKRLRDLGLDSYESYCALLQSVQGAEEIDHLIDLVSTNHTHFYREAQHFEFLRDRVLKDIPDTSARPFQVWSAACSSGEEPYSIALTLADYYLLRRHAAWHVHATDISHRMLKRARSGVYAHDELRSLPPEWLRLYFERGMAASQGLYRVRHSVSSHVTFHHLNLFQAHYPFNACFDVIFCRNVMIYFDRKSQEQLVNNLTRHLLPGGYLLVGHAESLLGTRHQLRYVQPSIYQRPSNP